MLYGKVAHLFDRLDSTNAEALRLLRQRPLPPEWTSISAAYQTAGRGQSTNTWFSSPDRNLLFSVITYPKLEVSELFRLTQVHSLAMAAALDELLASVGFNADPQLSPATTGIKVKWPNDIYVNNRKVAGLLLQNSLQGSRIHWSVLGVGLNLNETDFPADISDRAASLLELSGAPEPFDRHRCLELILDTLKSTYEYYLRAHHADDLITDYTARLYRYGESHLYRRAEAADTFRATLTGVTPEGRLALRLTDGQTELFDLKSIVFA